MQIYFLKGKSKSIWANNKSFVLFVLAQLLFLSIIKLIFYNYNYSLLFSEHAELNNSAVKMKMVGWSLLYDCIIVFGINFLFLFFIQAAQLFKYAFFSIIVAAIFFIINTFVLLVNVVDVFYFKFHFQRLNADIRFVIDRPFQTLLHQPFHIIIFIVLLFLVLCFISFKLHRAFYKKFVLGNNAFVAMYIFILSSFIMFVNKESVFRRLSPTSPLVNLSNQQLPVVQNSFHTFIYSLFREGQYLPVKKYFSTVECDSMFPIIHNADTTANNDKKNIVLFIMESVPYEFFDNASKYKVRMPFFDSLIQKSNFYTKAYAYAFESNKGIVSVLAGEPTLTDIPLYHSAYVNMPITPVGKALSKNGYYSFFCIGDDYDNFGFAKCTNWLGINKYYCKDDMGGNKGKPLHTMGMQDEYVLDFFHKKIGETKQPFLAINYNVSTHYPYDIPESYGKQLPANYTKSMKAMSYYDNSLDSFFIKSKKESWFNNTVFIFCPDHWMFPNEHSEVLNNRSSFHIPIIIYDPSSNEKKVNAQLASQFDVLGTILGIAGNKENYISYGNNLLSSKNMTNTVFTKMSNHLYQAIDSTYVLGYNNVTEKPEYLYDFNVDEGLKINLINTINVKTQQEDLTKKVKAFLQKATMQYNRQVFK
jgi:phosphoglycerol transferase MdoB-like AlkP superfamily enzyme